MVLEKRFQQHRRPVAVIALKADGFILFKHGTYKTAGKLSKAVFICTAQIGNLVFLNKRKAYYLAALLGANHICRKFAAEGLKIIRPRIDRLVRFRVMRKKHPASRFIVRFTDSAILKWSVYLSADVIHFSCFYFIALSSAHEAAGKQKRYQLRIVRIHHELQGTTCDLAQLFEKLCADLCIKLIQFELHIAVMHMMRIVIQTKRTDAALVLIDYVGIICPLQCQHGSAPRFFGDTPKQLHLL